MTLLLALPAAGILERVCSQTVGGLQQEQQRH
jgi:hypothetical protein